MEGSGGDVDLQDITNQLEEYDMHISGAAAHASPACSADDTLSVASAGSLGRPASASSCGSGANKLPPQPARRRGGYKDGGGLATEGQLVCCEPIHVGSERELRNELESIAAALDPSVNWDRRVSALARCEALVTGGAAGFSSFTDLLRSLLRDLVSLQIADRRSAVSRQACHLVAVLAEALGHAFGGLALHFVQDLLKMVVITIQIMADAADGALAAVLRHCRVAALLPPIALPLIADRSVKLRHCCAAHLLQALETWQPSQWRRALQPVARGVAAACGDSAADTRALGRAMYGVLTAAVPDVASIALAAMTPTAQRQLFSAAAAAAPHDSQQGARSAPASRAASRPSSRPGSSGSGFTRAAPTPLRHTCHAAEASVLQVMPVAVPHRQCSTVDSSRSAVAAPGVPRTPWSRAADADGYADASSDGGQPGELPSSVASGRPRRSVGMPRRISMAPRRTSQPLPGRGDAAEASDPVAAGPLNPRLSAPVGRALQLGRPPRRVSQAVHATSAAGAGSFTEPAAVSSAAADPEQLTAVGASTAGGDTPTIRSLVTAIEDAGCDWGTRAAAYDGLRLLLWHAGRDAAPALAAEAGALLPLVAEHLGSAHARVAAAAAGALSAAAATCGPTLEPHLDRFVAALFGATVSPKQEVADAACKALEDAASAFDPELLVAACAAALGTVRGGPHGRIAVLDFFSRQLAPRLRQQAVDPVSSGGGGGGGGVSSSRALRTWVRRVTPLAGDKHPDIRAAAAAALAAAEQVSSVAAAPAPSHAASNAQPVSFPLPDAGHAAAATSHSPTQAPAAVRFAPGRSAEMRLSAEFEPASHQLPPSPAASHRSAGSCPSPGGQALGFAAEPAGPADGLPADGTDAASQASVPQDCQRQARFQRQQPEAAPVKPRPPPTASDAAVCADGAVVASPDDAGATVPGTPPQLPARNGRPVHSEDGGELQRKGGPDAASTGGESVTQAEGVAAVRGCHSSGAMAQQNETGHAAFKPPRPPSGAMSPYDRALAAHLTAASRAAAATDNSNDSSSSGTTTSMHSAAASAGTASEATLGGSCITARLPTDPVVRSFRREVATAASAVRPATDANLAGSPTSCADARAAEMLLPAGPVVQQAPQPDSQLIGRATIGNSPAGRAPCSDGSSGSGSEKLPADRLRALAAQPLSPPPWAHPDTLTPTGTTAQALKVGLLTNLATLPSPPNGLGNGTGTSGGVAVAVQAAATAAGFSGAGVGCTQPAGGTAVQGVSDGGGSGGGAGSSASAGVADLLIQGRRMVLQPQPQCAPAKIPSPLPLPPAAPVAAAAAWAATPATPSEGAATARSHGAAAGTTSAFAACITSDAAAAAGATSALGSFTASAAAAPASTHRPQASAAKPPRQPQPPGGRLSVAERAAALLDGCATDADSWAAGAELAGMAAAAPAALLAALAPRLLSSSTDPSDGPAIQAALAGVKAVIGALPEASLAAAAGPGRALLPPLFATFSHPAADVRKATVMALVELCLRLGDEAQPLLAPLALSQAKLLAIYVQRAQTAGRPAG